MCVCVANLMIKSIENVFLTKTRSYIDEAHKYHILLDQPSEQQKSVMCNGLMTTPSVFKEIHAVYFLKKKSVVCYNDLADYF